MKLDKEFKEKWLTALRSGEYQQAQESLRGSVYGEDDFNDDEVGYCCLGVAASISGVDMQEYGGCCMLDEIPTQFTINQGIPEILCQSFRDKDTKEVTIAGKLASMNDNGSTFLEISNWIEENL